MIPLLITLQVMERLLVEAAAKDAACIERYVGFASSGVTMANIGDLLNHAVHLKSGTAVHTRLMRVLPFLTYVDGDKMSLVIRHFEDVLDFERFDAEHGADDHAKVEAFVAMCEGIERNQVRKCSFGGRGITYYVKVKRPISQIGNTMKSQMLEMGIVSKCVEHLRRNAPPITSVLVKADDPFWKEFVSKASLRYILRTLAGLAVDHSPTQLLISEQCIPILHQMEQVSSDEHVGSLAEAVLEAMAGCDKAEEKVSDLSLEMYLMIIQETQLKLNVKSV